MPAWKDTGQLGKTAPINLHLSTGNNMHKDIPLGPGLSTAAPFSRKTKGMLLGLAGVALFSLTLLGAALILGEALEWSSVLFAVAVIAVVAAGRKMRIGR